MIWEALRQTAEMQPDGAVAGSYRHQHIAVSGVFELIEIRPQYERAFMLATASFGLEPRHVEFPEL